MTGQQWLGLLFQMQIFFYAPALEQGVVGVLNT
jgi:hypothetical protein